MKKNLVLKVLKSGGEVSKGVGTKLSPKIPRGSGWDYLTSEVHKVHDKLLNVRNLEHDLDNHGAEYHDAMLKMIKMFQKDTEGIGSLRNYFMNVKESDIFTHPLYVQGEMKIHDMVEFDPVTSTLLKSIELKSKLEGSWTFPALKRLDWAYSKTGVDAIELTHLTPEPGNFLETARAINEAKELLFIDYSSIDVSDLWNYPLDVESKELVHAAIDHSISLHPYLSEAYTFYLQNDLYFVKAAEASSAVLV